MKQTIIPQRIDEPPHILMWQLDELLPMLLGLVIGIFIGQALICSVLGYTVTHQYRKFRDNHPNGHLVHMLYYNGFLSFKGKTMVNTFVKKYFP